MTALIITGIGLALIAGLIFASRKWGRKDAEGEQKERDLKDAKKEAQKWADAGNVSTPDRLRRQAKRKRGS